MPDHVHASAYRVNRLLGRVGPLWQEESFDRIIRRSEDLKKKADYICDNPVRAGLAKSRDEYQWIWRATG